MTMRAEIIATVVDSVVDFHSLASADSVPINASPENRTLSKRVPPKKTQGSQVIWLL